MPSPFPPLHGCFLPPYLLPPSNTCPGVQRHEWDCFGLFKTLGASAQLKAGWDLHPIHLRAGVRIVLARCDVTLQLVGSMV